MINRFVGRLNIERAVLKGAIRATACSTALAMAMMGGYAVDSRASAETLAEALSATYSYYPALLAKRAEVRAVDETVSQALSGWRPNITAVGSRAKTKFKAPAVGGIGFSGNSSQQPLTRQLTASQNVFAGGQTIFATLGANADVDTARADLTNTEQSVLLQAVSAYMDVLRDTAVLSLNRKNVEVLRRQLEASQDRFGVGEITRTDVAQSEARLSGSISGRTQGEANLIASRAAYERTIGHMPDGHEEIPPLPVLPESEEAAKATALEKHPQLVAAKSAERSAKNAVRGSVGALLPSVDVIWEQTKVDDVNSFFSETRTRTATARLTVPIYQGGVVHSQVRQARQVNNQRRIEVTQAYRQVVESVTNAWEGLRSARSRIDSGKSQVRANEQALNGVKQEAEVGSRTTLDVLDAEQELLDSRVSLVRAQRDKYVAAYQLLAAMGQLTAQDLGLSVEIYDPVQHYKNVRFKFLAIGDGERDVPWLPSVF